MTSPKKERSRTLKDLRGMLRQPLPEVDEQRCCIPPGLLSRPYKNLLIERSLERLFRQYQKESREHRNWHPDELNLWELRKSYPSELVTVLAGFLDVESYYSDYVEKLLARIRTSPGQSAFHILWGSQEINHPRLWENILLFSGSRTREDLEKRADQLRSAQWQLPHQNRLEMLFYTVFQERATLLNYRNLRLLAQGLNATMPGFRDLRLAEACSKIMGDEAAHFKFFKELALLYLYYYPSEAFEAMDAVIRRFAMPAGDIIPDYSHFQEVVARLGIYGKREVLLDVHQLVLAQLGVSNLKLLRAGLEKSREVPDENGNFQSTTFYAGFDFSKVEEGVKERFKVIEQYENRHHLPRTIFVPNRA